MKKFLDNCFFVLAMVAIAIALTGFTSCNDKGVEKEVVIMNDAYHKQDSVRENLNIVVKSEYHDNSMYTAVITIDTTSYVALHNGTGNIELIKIN